jgi:penicillin-binding protein 1A
MVESGYITRDQADAAYDDPPGLISPRPTGLQGYRDPYFTTYAIAQLDHLFGQNIVEQGGLSVYTTLDERMQQIGQEAVTWGVAQAVKEGIGAHQAALVALRPSTGEILAMIGGDGFSLTNQFNRAWQARRQPGSSFKIYDYTAAIDQGIPASTIIDDSPVSYPMGDGTMWSPRDDDNSYMGSISLREALTLSRNVVAVKLAERVGLDKVIDYAHRMGVTSPLEANLSLALGSSGVTVLDQASGYSTLANQGLHIDPTPFRLVKDSLGSSLLDNRVPQAVDVVSAGTAFIMTSIFEDVIAHGTGYPNAIIGRPAAGKTGTTSSFRDAWFVGYTPDLVAAVWLGNDNYTPMNESYGGNIPARIWARFMKAALASTPQHEFPYPSDEVTKIAGCGRGGYEYYLKGTEPQSGCGSSIEAYGENENPGTAAAENYVGPTVPPPDASPPDVLPPPPTETPLPVPSPAYSSALETETPTPRHRR